MSNNKHCIKGRIPFLFGFFDREITECHAYDVNDDHSLKFNMIEDSELIGLNLVEEYYMSNGLYHRDCKFGPARILYGNNEILEQHFYKRGLLHNVLGYAKLDFKSHTKEYYIDGIKYPRKEDFDKAFK